ncbi:MAG: type-F conjugative transfer system secretin TraK, partial [Gammaproteobacteria bacterium]
MSVILSRTGLPHLPMLTVVLAVMLAPAPGPAAEVAVSDGGTAKITVSAHELTRLTMSDGSHVAKVWAVEGAMHAQPDSDAGEVYIRPLGKSPGQMFSFFVRDEFGSTYTLAARVADVPSQTIRLTPAARAVPMAGGGGGSSADAHLQRIKTLIRGMASRPRTVPPGYTVEKVGQKLRGWKDTEVRLVTAARRIALRAGLRRPARRRDRDASAAARREHRGLLGERPLMALPNLPPNETVRKRQAIVTVTAFAVVIAIVVFGLWLSDPKRKAGRSERVDPASDYAADFSRPSGAIDPMDIWISRSEAELKALRRDNEQLRKDLGALRDELDRAAPTTEVPRFRDGSRVEDDLLQADSTLPPLPPLPGAQTAPKPRVAPPPPPPVSSAGMAAKPPSPPAGILSVSVSTRSGASSGAQSGPTLDNFLPIGFVSATLLSGLDAPTGGLAQTNPHPVLLRLSDNAWLPNRYR